MAELFVMDMLLLLLLILLLLLLLPASGVVDPEYVQSLQHCVGTPQIPVLAPFGHSVKDCVKGEEHCQKSTTATACYILL